MDDEVSSDLQKCLSDGSMETDEGPLINENSNGLSHLLTESEFLVSDSVPADESSASNQGFLNAVELSTGSVGDYLDNNTDGFNADSFDVGDNAVTFPSGDSLPPCDADFIKETTFDISADVTESQKTKVDTDFEQESVSEMSNDVSSIPTEDPHMKMDEDSTTGDIKITEANEITNDSIPTNESETIQNVKVEDKTPEKENGLENNETPPSKEAPEDKVIRQEIKKEPEPEAEPAPKPEVIDSVVLKIKKEPVLDEEMGESEKPQKPKDETATASDLPVKTEKVIPDVKIKTEIGGAEETENVSEDELPTVQKPSVKDAENVSDDELPGPKPAELPADTEVVSEDELPSAKKEPKESRKRKPDEEGDGYDPGSPTSESESSSKKQAVAKNGESKPIPAEKRSSIDEKPKKKVLPELDKYWKVVNDDPTDFTGWTYLLQYVDQESDVEAAREAYDAFLSHYPYCYGYWRKYADYEKRKGSKKKCLEVLERGLKSIPLSVDLWIHYLNHIKATRAEDIAYIRSQYERAIDACGLEFRSDRLWESYIKWEAEHGSALNVTNIYDRLLSTPTLGYTSHFDNFQEHVMSEPVTGVVAQAELVRLRGEVREAAGSQPQLDLPPGEDEPVDHVASEEEGQAIKERIIATRRKIHKGTGEEVAARWTFEEGIKRPYFHVKPLERCQLKNWKAYLEWEKQHGSFKRALVLHERCLIACALYEEFWMRLIKFLEERAETDASLISIEREVLERACTVHHLDKPELHLHWAHFEEAHGNTARAAEILDRIEKTCPCLVQIQYRRVNLERRRGDYEKCSQLYEGYIAAAKNKAVASALSIKYARFLFHVRGDRAAARKALDEAIAKEPLNHRLHLQRLDQALHTPGTPYEHLEGLVIRIIASALSIKYGRFLFHVRGDRAAARKALDEAIAKEPLNHRLHLQRLDLALHTPGTPYEQLEELVMSYEKQEGAEIEVSASMAWRRRELAEEVGDAAAARRAHQHARALAKHMRKRARKDKHDAPPPPCVAADVKKKESGTTTTTPVTTSSSSYYQTPAATAQSYEQSYAQPYQPPWGYQQPPGPYQHHGHPWPQYPNYY